MKRIILKIIIGIIIIVTIFSIVKSVNVFSDSGFDMDYDFFDSGSFGDYDSGFNNDYSLGSGSSSEGDYNYNYGKNYNGENEYRYIMTQSEKKSMIIIYCCIIIAVLGIPIFIYTLLSSRKLIMRHKLKEADNDGQYEWLHYPTV